MNCSNCGSSNNADARYCTNCGSPLRPSTSPASIVHEEITQGQAEAARKLQRKKADNTGFWAGLAVAFFTAIFTIPFIFSEHSWLGPLVTLLAFLALIIPGALVERLGFPFVFGVIKGFLMMFLIAVAIGFLIGLFLPFIFR